jgi:hypothetical protein
MVDNIQFEAVKSALRQSKDGYSLSLVIHPDDIPDDLVKDFVGSRYVVVMVRLNDEDQPMVREKETPGSHSVKMAAVLCRDMEFWAWVNDAWDLSITTEEACKQWLCEYLGIESRTELKTDTEARGLFETLRNGFYDWREHNAK